MIPLAKRVRDMTWEDYGIEKNRFIELRAFCLQYDEKKLKINRGIGAMSYDGMPKGNFKKNTLEDKAIRNAGYQRDIDMIEDAARMAEPCLFPYIIKSVTQSLSYQYIEYDEEHGKIPVGKTDFYAYRRLFYYYLHKMKLGEKIDLIKIGDKIDLV